jgi:hypothetical protein
VTKGDAMAKRLEVALWGAVALFLLVLLPARSQQLARTYVPLGWRNICYVASPGAARQVSAPTFRPDILPAGDPSAWTPAQFAARYGFDPRAAEGMIDGELVPCCQPASLTAQWPALRLAGGITPVDVSDARVMCRPGSTVPIWLCAPGPSGGCTRAAAPPPPAPAPTQPPPPAGSCQTALARLSCLDSGVEPVITLAPGAAYAVPSPLSTGRLESVVIPEALSAGLLEMPPRVFSLVGKAVVAGGGTSGGATLRDLCAARAWRLRRTASKTARSDEVGDQADPELAELDTRCAAAGVVR